MRFAFCLVLAACGSTPVAGPADRCVGEREAPSIIPHGGRPMQGGANAWVEIAASHVEASPADNHVLLDGVEVPIARVREGGEEAHALDATAGQLTPRQTHASAASAGHVLGFRIPAGTPAGPHELALRTCNTTSAETIPFEVLPDSAPAIASVRLVRGEVWPSLFIKGERLSGAVEVILVTAAGPESVTSLTNVTRIDDTQLRVSVEKPGTYEVFVRSAGGIGGGPPGGMVTVR